MTMCNLTIARVRKDAGEDTNKMRKTTGFKIKDLRGRFRLGCGWRNKLRQQESEGRGGGGRGRKEAWMD